MFVERVIALAIGPWVWCGGLSCAASISLSGNGKDEAETTHTCHAADLRCTVLCCSWNTGWGENGYARVQMTADGPGACAMVSWRWCCLGIIASTCADRNARFGVAVNLQAELAPRAATHARKAP